jgi:hypothetical protein
VFSPFILDEVFSIIYFISCDCIVIPSLSYTIYYDPLNDEYPQQCVVRHNLSSVRSRARHLAINDRQDMFEEHFNKMPIEIFFTEGL